LCPNCQLENIDTGEQRAFTLLQVVFVNLWDCVLRLDTSTFRMIDSDGFQHPSTKRWESYCLRLPSMKTSNLPNSWDATGIELFTYPNGAAAIFPPPRHNHLEGKAKTVGWVWFECLPEGVRPARMIYRQDVYAPGHTSGWVQHVETLEFIIPNSAVVPSQLALPAQ
jgi:hypothetical protein